MKTKYYNDAVVGNKNMIVSFSEKGELLRIFCPSPDYRQFIDFFHTGVKVNDSALIYLHDDINNRYNQYYTDETNILNTEIENTYFNLKVVQTDFVCLRDNILVKQYTFENNNSIDLDVDFLIHSSSLSSFNNMVGGRIINNALLQYSHSYSLCIFSNEQIHKYQLNNSKYNIRSGEISGKDYIGMSPDSSISYKIGTIKPNEKKKINICLYINDNNEISSFEDIENKIIQIAKQDINKEKSTTEKYWKKYLHSHNTLEIEEKTEYDKKISKIFKRSILLFPLLMNQNTGGMIAALEVDEETDECGRYSYCWPRDASVVAQAFDMIKMEKEVDKFYKIFCKNTQNKDGLWEQRFYTDGRLAPCWGYQIDETASVVFGVYAHYMHTKDVKFLKDTLKMCEKAVVILEKYIDGITGKKEEEDLVKKEIEEKRQAESKLNSLSFDLWENNEGIHLYSLAGIYAAFNAMIYIHENVKGEYENNRLKLESMSKSTEKMQKYKDIVKKYIEENLYDETTKTFKRAKDDYRMDISMIGAVMPFRMFAPTERKIVNTVEKINMTLRTYTGGYLRYENDHYMGGKNPWPIATLWMAIYYLQIGEMDKAKECINFVVNTATKHGFLAEQIDNETMKPKWVIGLGWSHAMFIIAIKVLYRGWENNGAR